MAELIGVEADIEQALAAEITARLAAVPLTGVRIDTFLGGGPGEEMVKPSVFVMCSPANAVKRGSLYECEGIVVCETSHLTGKDRDADNLATLFKHVAAALDHGNFTQHALVLSSIETVREGGQYEVESSTNRAEISVKILACGSSS